jgi:hypothetical protein
MTNTDSGNQGLIRRSQGTLLATVGRLALRAATSTAAPVPAAVPAQQRLKDLGAYCL